ncbi:hypothetical protein [Chryseobacterium artocarpi]|uniref:hypothetical protein n=1 Tax=Chryseobacterium artocarpi TaxID=1414727 RepID=UPI003F35A1C0
MNKAAQYNLIFKYDLAQGMRKPNIDLIDSNGPFLDIASFLAPNGVNGTDSIIFDIKSLVFDGRADDVTVWGYHDSESIEVRYHPQEPAVIILNKLGTEVFVPVDDFIKILEEWKFFLLTVPKPHWLDRR